MRRRAVAGSAVLGLLRSLNFWGSNLYDYGSNLDDAIENTLDQMDNLVVPESPRWQKVVPYSETRPVEADLHVSQEQASQEFGVASATCTIPGEDPPAGDGQK